ncbi:MAG: MG2 domain-containing protein, partial [Burkholderiaceae bacterium]
MTANAASITSVSPQGEVAQVRQITVKFSEPVVPLGDLRLPDPMLLSCEGATPPGAGRWSTERVWLYDFREPLPPGTRCTLTLRAGWKPALVAARGLSASAGPGAPASATGNPDRPGAVHGSATVYRFNTGGPAIVSVRPHEGGEIEEGQYFMLHLNGAALESTVLEHAWCEVEGIGEKLGVRVIAGAERAELLKARHIDKPREIERTLVLECQRPLPSGAEVHLVWGRGIAAAANPKVATRIEQRQHFTVRAAFTAEFRCERERANAPCLPVRPMRLRFSAPVARAVAAQVRLKPASGVARAPLFDKDDHAAEVSEINFPAPLPPNMAFKLELPSELRDDAGRVLSNAGAFPLKTATGDAPPIAKFAAAPFGVVELSDAMLPVTLRHVQSELRPAPINAAGGPGSPSGAPSATPPASGQVRLKRLDSDAEILAWYAKLRQYDETRLSARELGRPETEWYVFEDDTDAKGRPIKRRVERRIGSREISLLQGDSGAKRLDLPQLDGGDPRPFEVVGIPLPEPGYHVVEIESNVLGHALLDKPAPMYVRTGVLVTNLGVHFKLGRENSLVWVTSLDRGQPVADAQVAVNDCNGHRLWAGRTDAQGLARIARSLEDTRRSCVADNGLFVTARKSGPAPDAKARGAAGAIAKPVTDVAFVFSSWQKGIESWRFNVSTANGSTPDARATTVLDRSLFRAGETVAMKHFFRLETLGGLANAQPADLPTRLKIVHQGSGQEFVQPLAWRGVRSAVSSWEIPPAARLGVYEVVLEREGERGTGRERTRWSSGSFRVEEFRTPLVDARVSGPKSAVIAPKELAVAAQLSYFSGGGMSQVAARASALLKSRPASFAGYEEFSFDPPRDPEQQRSSNFDEDEYASEPDARDARLVADKLALTTDRNGAANFTLSALPKITQPSSIDAELTFNDPNGEVQTVSTSIPVWPSAVVLGVKAGSWASARGRVKFTAVALDTTGKPLKGQQVEVRGRVSQTLSTRKRMVGGFYAYDNRTEVKDLGALCSGTTDDHGLLACEASLDSAGQVELIAHATDAHGNPVQAATSVWVTKQGELWFAQDNDDRIDVLAEKTRYEPGETARLQVRMPYREATALVAVEREGVIETRVVTLRGDDPTLELKIDKSWAPNVYVSVLALRGRIRETPWYSFFTWGWKEPLNWVRSFWFEGREYQAPTAMVDLAKPSFKLGVAALRVGLAAHELKVSVTSDKPVYAVRQTAQARIRVSFEGKPLAGTEVAFAAVDEGLLALRDNGSWDLLHAMIQPRAWGVETSTAQSE